jgi:hypothetical protein
LLGEGGHAEVEHDRLAVGSHHDVGRLDVAVNDPTGVRRVQGAGGGLDELQGLAQLIRVGRRVRSASGAPLLEPLGQGLALDVLHGEPGVGRVGA